MSNIGLVGETIVYVADGRGDVSIKQLADEGKDVPVFCFDENNYVCIHMMYFSKCIKNTTDVYKITLDDGSIVKATSDQQIRLRNKTYKLVSELKYGDSLKLLTKFDATFDDLGLHINRNSEKYNYRWITGKSTSGNAEQRVIAAFHANIEFIPKGHVVHHIDFNPANNSPNNLQIMTSSDHYALHAKNKFGDNNPMRIAKRTWTTEQWKKYHDRLSEAESGANNGNANPVTNEELRKHFLKLTKEKGRRISNNEWQKYAKPIGLPLIISKYRQVELGTMRDLELWAAKELGFENGDLDTRTLRKFNRHIAEGHNCEIINERVFFHKICEICGSKYSTRGIRSTVCSQTCSSKRNWQDETYRNNVEQQKVTSQSKPGYREMVHSAQKATFDARKKQLANRQVEVYSNLKFELGREPDKKEWIMECKRIGVSIEISRKSSPFRYYKDLREQASMFNHKVVSVDFDSIADVYICEVNKVHNVCVGGFQSTCKNGKFKMAYINALTI
jgi:hypothetical protein